MTVVGTEGSELFTVEESSRVEIATRNLKSESDGPNQPRQGRDGSRLRIFAYAKTREDEDFKRDSDVGSLKDFDVSSCKGPGESFSAQDEPPSTNVPRDEYGKGLHWTICETPDQVDWQLRVCSRFA
jgi:hypothetical protein